MTLLSDIDTHEAFELLRFYVEAGVTDGLDEEPVDRYALLPVQPTVAAPALGENTGERRADSRISAGSSLGGQQGARSETRTVAERAPTTSRAASSATPAAPVSSLEEVATAKALAASANSLDELKAALNAFDTCPLKATAKNLVFADGNPEADIMLVGESPGRDEDLQGVPFVGQAGHLLDRMLAAIGYDRSRVYITNTLPWRPPGNRQPTAQELAMCAPFLERHIELVRPKILMLVGGVSAKQLLSTNDGIMKIRGKWKNVKLGDMEIPAMPILHPAYLLRMPAHKKLAWADLQDFRDRANSLSG